MDLPRGVIAVDATREAAPLWAGPFLSVLEELASLLPATAEPEVAFLGDSRTYPLGAVLRGLDPTGRPPGPVVPVEPNLGRCPLIGPLMRTMIREPARTVAVVTNSPVIDLEDWDIPEIRPSLIVYRLMGAERLGAGNIAEWSPADAELSRVADFLRNPVTELRIGGNGVLPLAWDAPAYQWESGWLVGRNPEGSVVHVCTSGESLPTAVAVRANGGRCEVAPVPCEPREEGETFELTPAEGVVLDLWRGGTPYSCRSCGQLHKPGQVGCPGQAAGAGPLPTLSALPPGTICLITRYAGGWSGRTVPSRVVPLSEDRALVWHGEDGRLYAKDNAEWSPVAQWDKGMTGVEPDKFLIQS